MNTFIRSSSFDAWLSGLSDLKAKARILARLQSAIHGNFGDSEPVGEGISEILNADSCRCGLSGLLHSNMNNRLPFVGWR